MAKAYEEREIRLALEWAALSYPGARVISRYRILTGPLPVVPGFAPFQVAQLLKPTGLMADLVIPLGKSTVVVQVESKKIPLAKWWDTAFGDHLPDLEVER